MEHTWLALGLMPTRVSAWLISPSFLAAVPCMLMLIVDGVFVEVPPMGSVASDRDGVCEQEEQACLPKQRHQPSSAVQNCKVADTLHLKCL